MLSYTSLAHTKETHALICPTLRNHIFSYASLAHLRNHMLSHASLAHPKEQYILDPEVGYEGLVEESDAENQTAEAGKKGSVEESGIPPDTLVSQQLFDRYLSSAQHYKHQTDLLWYHLLVALPHHLAEEIIHGSLSKN